MNDVDIGRLTLEIAANAKGASSQITNIKKSLQGLQETVSGLSGLAQVSQQMQSMAKGFSAISSATANMTGFRTAKTALKGTTEALQQLKSVDITAAKQQLKTIGDAFKGLSSIEKGGFSSTVNALKKLPDVAKSLAGMDMDKFASDCDAAATAIRPLADEMEKVSAGFAAFPQKMGAMNQAAARTTNVFGKLENVFNRVFSVMMLRKVGSIIGNWINLSTQYTEDLNLFTVAMGKYADSAQEYAEKVSEVMGIDVADWLRHQGVFMTLATGFGVASDRAAIMSKNLTQLAYDLSSFYNLDVDEAMQKLESGFAGEIEPVRRLGYDLSKTTLQATAASLGITKLFADMTQAEKSQLRYYALMTQVTQVQGDMARTLEAPANQLRIFQAQLEMTKRALGNIFIPALNAVLPYVIAFVKFIRLLADEIARLFGFSLPEIDYSSVNTGIASVADETDDLSDSLGRTYNRAKQVKNLLASFDELNIIQSETGGGSGAGSGGIGGIGSSGWNDFALPEYDFLSNVISSKVDTIFAKMRKTLEKMKPTLKYLKDNFGAIKGIVLGILEGILGWKLAKGLGFGSKTAAGIGLSILGFSTEFSGARAIGRGDTGLIDYLKTAIGAALGIAGSLIVFGTGPAGWIIGIGAALSIFFTGLRVGESERQKEEIGRAFADLFTGAIDSTDYAAIVAERFSGMTARLQMGIELEGKISDDRGILQEIETTIGNYKTKLEGVGKLTSDEIDQMNSAFGRLKSEGAVYIGETFDLLENGLLLTLQKLPEETRTAVSGYLTALQGLEGEELSLFNEATAKYEYAMNQAAMAGISEEDRRKWLEEATEAQRVIGILAGTYTDAIGEWNQAKVNNGISYTVDDINFADADAIMRYFDDVSASYDEAFGKINQYWNTAITEAVRKRDAAIALGLDSSEYDNIIEALTMGKNADIVALQNAFDAETQPIIEKMMDRAQTIFEGEVSKGPSLGETLYGYFYSTIDRLATPDEETDKFMRRNAASSIYENYLKPILDNIANRGGPEAREAAQEIVNGGYEGLIDEFERIGWVFESEMDNFTNEVDEKSGKWGSKLMDQILNRFKGLAPQAHDTGAVFGNGLILGMYNEITEGKGLIFEAIRNNFDDVSDRLADKAGWLGRTLGRGIGNGMSGALSNVGRQLIDWWGQFSLPVPRVAANNGSANPSDWLNVPIPAFASGGFPTSGALFIAGENPELVGTMGGRTAVANGDQIVTGIAYGVSQANGEQNRLLREQNTLLRQLVAQGGKVVFSPSPEAGRAVEMSLNMYATQRGY